MQVCYGGIKSGINRSKAGWLEDKLKEQLLNAMRLNSIMLIKKKFLLRRTRHLTEISNSTPKLKDLSIGYRYIT